MNNRISITDRKSLVDFIYWLEEEAEFPINIEIEQKDKIRTPTQNASLHLFLSKLADVLNNAGLDMKRTLKAEVDIPWTKESAKEHLWKPIQKALTQKESTTEMTTVEPTLIRETLCRHLGQKFGITCPPWPSKEEMYNEAIGRRFSKGGKV